MGTNSALQFCFRLFFFVALSHGAAIRPDVAEDGNAAVVPDEICPCMSRLECPRAFGSQPEDALLGNFPPCEDPNFVRCCGVSTTVSVEHSTSEGVQYPGKSKPGLVTVPVVPPGVVVPVQIRFPEYVDPRTTTISPSYDQGEEVEYYDDYYDDENEGDDARHYVEAEEAADQARGKLESEKSAVLNQGKTLRGENIDEDASQVDAFVSSDHLDYSGVNKLSVTGAGVQTTNVAALSAGNRGEISSSKRVESTSSTSSSSSSTSSSEKSESIVSTGSSSSLGKAQGLTISELPKEEPELIDEGDHFQSLKTGLRDKTAFENHQETLSQQKSEKVTKESSNSEQTSSSSVSVANQEKEEDVLSRGRRPIIAIESASGDDASYQSRTQVSNEQRSESVAKESKNVEESNYSNVESVALGVNANEASEIAGTVHGELKESTSQQQSNSVKKESSSFEESSSSQTQSVSTNVGNQVNVNEGSSIAVDTRQPALVVRRRPTSNRGNVVYGQRVNQLETSSQQQSNSLKKESTSLEESTSSKVQSVNTNIGSRLNVNEGSSIAVATRQPNLEVIRRPTTNRGNVVYGQQINQLESSSQQQSNSLKKESSHSEESTSSQTQSVSTNVGNQVNANQGSNIAVAARQPALGVRRRPTTNRGNVVYGQRFNQLETSSQQQTNSLKKESSSFEESSSSQAQSVSTNVGNQLNVNEGSSIALATRQPNLEVIRRPTTNSGNVVYGQQINQLESSSQQQSNSLKKESSSLEESTSSKVQSVNTNIGSRLNVNEGSSIAIAPVTRGDDVYGQRMNGLETSSQQKSNSLKKESSNFEESSSSKVQSSSTNTGNQLSENEGLNVVVATRRPVTAVRRRPIVNRGNVDYGQRKQTSSIQQSNSAKKESSSFEENTSSNVQTSAINTANLLDARPPVPGVRSPITNRGRVSYGQQAETSSQQQSSSVKKESSSFEEKTSSNAQTIATSTSGSSNRGLSSEVAATTGLFVPALVRPAVNRGHVIYGQQGETSSHQESTSVKKESSSSQENSSSNVESTITNTELGLIHNDANSAILDTSSIGEVVSGQRKESSSHEESTSSKKESSSFEENSSSSNVKTSNAAELLHDQSAFGQLTEATSTKASSRMEKESSSREEKNTSSNIAQVVITDQTRSNVESRVNIDDADQIQSSIINRNTADAIHGDRVVTSAIKKNEMTSSKSSSSKKESSSTSTSSNLSTMVTGQKSLGSTAVVSKASNMHADTNREKSSQVWRVANRNYVPVLINAGFLRDRPTATGAVGLDPLSGVTHSDIWDARLAAELLPLSCGNVVFGERSKDSRTLVCDIPEGNSGPIRFLGGDNRAALNREKVDGPMLLDAIVPGEGQTHIVSENVMHGGSSITNESLMKSTAESRRTENSRRTESRASESHSEDLARITTAEGAKTVGQTRIANENMMHGGSAITNESLMKSTTESRRTENSRRTESRASESHSEDSARVTTAEGAKTIGQTRIANENMMHGGSAITNESLMKSTTESRRTENSVRTESRVSESRSEDSARITTAEGAKTIGQTRIANDNVMYGGSAITNESLMKSTTESRRTENSRRTESRASESRSEDSARITTAQGAKTVGRRPLRRRIIGRRPVPVPVVVYDPKKEPVAVPRPRPNMFRGRIRYPNSELAAKAEQSAVGSRQVSQESSSRSSSSSTMANSVLESNSQQGITKSEFDISSADQYDAEREFGNKNSKLYLLPVAPILPRPDNLSPESRPKVARIVEVVDEAPAVTRTRVSRKRMRNLSSGRKQPPKELEVLNIRRSEDDGANVEEAQFVSPAESLSRSNSHSRGSRQVKEFAPEAKAATISSEELSMPGRVTVIGPIPAGYKDPALDKKEDLGADQLPAIDRLPALDSADNFGKKIAARDTRHFHSSPVDPVNWT